MPEGPALALLRVVSHNPRAVVLRCNAVQPDRGLTLAGPFELRQREPLNLDPLDADV